MGQTYRMPAPAADVANLVPESNDGNSLTPTTTVLCIHRGRHRIVDKFDGQDYVILPGQFMAPYGAALHFQNRAVIPGTRNPELGVQQSYIGIIGLDSDEMCEPLTDDEVDRFGAAVEAIDRSSLTDPADRTVTVLKTGAAAGRVRGQGGSKRPQIDTSAQASDAAREAAEHAFDSPGTSAAAEDAAEAASESVADVGRKVRKR